jgi:hypothetical protein
MMTVSEVCTYEIDAFDNGECVFEFTWTSGMDVAAMRRGWYGKDGLFEVNIGSLYGPDAEIPVLHAGECTWDHVKESARRYVQRQLMAGELTKGGE